jgi:hypothetical protein
MKNMIFILFTFAFFACSTGKQNEFSESADATTSEQKPMAVDAPSDLYSNGKTKLIKTVDYRFSVENVKQSTEAIETSVKKYSAYFSSSTLNLEGGLLESKITIRVQNDFFQDLLKDIDKQAVNVEFRNVSTNDVSKDFVDLESRLKTKREVEERYMEILRKKAGTIKELLEAEKQIGELHEEIEATISRLNFLKDQVSYSTINLEFYQPVLNNPIASDEGLGKKFAEAFSSGLSGLMNVVIGLAYIWPIVILSAAAFFIYRRKKLSSVS